MFFWRALRRQYKVQPRRSRSLASGAPRGGGERQRSPQAARQRGFDVREQLLQARQLLEPATRPISARQIARNGALNRNREQPPPAPMQNHSEGSSQRCGLLRRLVLHQARHEIATFRREATSNLAGENSKGDPAILLKELRVSDLLISSCLCKRCAVDPSCIEARFS